MSYYKKDTYNFAPIFQVNGKYVGNYYALRSQLSDEQTLYLMKHFNYSDENYAIMAGDKDYLKKTNSSLFSNSGGKMKRRDDRTDMQYFQDLVAGWLYEDMLILSIHRRNSNIKIRLNGGDSTRCILGHKVTNEPDFKVIYKNKYILIEMAMSHTNYCYNTGKIHLRNNKREHLISRNSLFLEINTEATSAINKKPTYALLTSSDLTDFIKEIQWGKESDCIFISKEQYKPMELLTKDIENMISLYGTILLS